MPRCLRHTPAPHILMQLSCSTSNGAPLIWGGFGWMRGNKSLPRPDSAAPRRCRVKEVLCHHMKPKGPLAEKTQNQLSSPVFP